MGRGREEVYKQIEDLLISWRDRLTNRGKAQLFDLHHISEDSSAHILNEIYGFALKNVNKDKIGTAIIDLKDDEEKLYIQVTSDGGTRKVRKTITDFHKSKFLDKEYECKVFVLGFKSKRLPEQIEVGTTEYSTRECVFDFYDLCNSFRHMSMTRLKRLLKLVESEILPAQKVKRKTGPSEATARLKRNKKVRDEFAKKMMFKIDLREDRSTLYDPYRKFRYSQVLLREVSDRTFPDTSETLPDNFTWNKNNLYDTYEYGLEFVDSMGQKIGFLADDKWFKIRHSDESFENIPGIRTDHLHTFYRLPYDQIQLIDMETDEYYALPSLYITLQENGWPWESIVFGRMGNAEKRRCPWYLEVDDEVDSPLLK